MYPFPENINLRLLFHLPSSSKAEYLPSNSRSSKMLHCRIYRITCTRKFPFELGKYFSKILARHGNQYAEQELTKIFVTDKYFGNIPIETFEFENSNSLFSLIVFRIITCGTFLMFRYFFTNVRELQSCVFSSFCNSATSFVH